MAQSQPTVERNIVLIGKSGSGKSTLGNKLLGREAFATGDGPDPVTKACEWKSACSNCRIGKPPLELNVLDTPGLQDLSCSNDAVMRKIILKAQEKQITAVVFVLKQDRITDEVGMFNDICKRYKKASSVSALVITNCDWGNRDTLEESFKTNDSTQKIAAFMKLGISTVGFPSSSTKQATLGVNIPQDTKQATLGVNISQDALKVIELIDRDGKFEARDIFK